MTRFLRPLLALALMVTLAACSSSKRQNPVGSGDEVGQFEEEKPSTYTAKEGDTLRKIAGRPEIYGDPNLWPVLQEANAEALGQSTRVNKGTILDIPRDLSEEQLEEAREKARQAAAASKSGDRPKRRPSAEVSFDDKPKEAATPEAVVTPEAPQPVPKAKKGGMLMPILLILLIILGALAAVLFFYMKKDSQEEPKD